MTTAPLTVGAGHLDHRDVVVVQVAGQARPIGAGAFHPDTLDGAQAIQPRQRAAVAGAVGREGLHTQLGASLVQSGDQVHVAVGVDACRHAHGCVCHCCRRHPLVGS